MVHSMRAVLPDLRSLWEVFVPGTRFKVAQVFVEHDIQLGEQFDDLLVGVVVIGKDVVTDSVAARPPEQRNADAWKGDRTPAAPAPNLLTERRYGASFDISTSGN